MCVPVNILTSDVSEKRIQDSKREEHQTFKAPARSIIERTLLPMQKYQSTCLDMTDFRKQLRSLKPSIV